MAEGEAQRDVFPHDRVVFFSDAVFAIAITLLAIELHAPDAEQIGRIGASAAWSETVSLSIAFVISFMVLAVFWRGHMQTWKQVTRATGGLVWCSLLQLMFVTLMPFATRAYSHGGEPGWFAFYSLVLACISLFAWLTRWLAARQENLREKIGAEQAKWFLARGLVPLAVFAASIPLAWALPSRYGAFAFMLIFPLSRIVRWWCFRSPKPEPGA
jgi:uncharacterized membrane protein